VLKGKSLSKILYPAKRSFRSEEEIKCFPEKQKLKEFITTNPALQGMFFKLKRKGGHKNTCERINLTGNVNI